MDTAHGAGGTPATPFADLSVVELAGDPGGETLGKLFATMGADVIKVELPEGAPSRYVGPAAAGLTTVTRTPA